MKSIAVIGAGRLGTALAHALARKGFAIRALCCRTLKSARESVRIAGAGIPTTDPARAARDADIVILSVPDDRLGPVVRRLTASSIAWKGKTVLHTSGLHGSGILEPLRKKGASTASLHPIQTFPRKDTGPKMFKGIGFGLEGEPRARKDAADIARKLGGRPLTVKEEGKPLYHAALVLASGGTTALLETSIMLLEAAGFERKEAAAIRISLAEETLRNIKSLPPGRALTGPFVRGDARTVRGHLEALSGNEAASALYRAVGGVCLEIAEKQGVPGSRIKALKRILRSERLPLRGRRRISPSRAS